MTSEKTAMGLTPTAPKIETIVIAITPYLITFTAAIRPVFDCGNAVVLERTTQMHHQLSLFF